MRRLGIRFLKLACGIALVGACGGATATSERASGSGGDTVTSGGTAAGGMAAGGTEGTDCRDGTERCPCYGNGTCNEGLVCASDRCVDLGSGGNEGSSGSTSSGPEEGGGENEGGTSSGGETAGGPSPGGENQGGIRGGGETAGGNSAGGWSTAGAPPTVCGNGVVEVGETCDPPATCPTSCNDNNHCTTDMMTGSNLTCDAVCINSVVTACNSNDGCCPAGCDATDDADCTTLCGNGVMEVGETCDPPTSCPVSCDDGNPCTVDLMTGSGSHCNVVCRNTIVTACTPGDGCCPSACTSDLDSDCT